MKTPEILEYVPARPHTGAFGRLIKLCLVLAVLFLAFAWHRSGMTDTYASDGMVVFGFIGFCFGAVGLLTSIALWVRTGRFW